VIVRPTQASDVAQVSALEAELFGRDAWSPKLVEGELTHHLRQSVVAAEGDTLIGYAVLFAVGDTVDLEQIAVSVHHRRRGVALALLDGLSIASFPRVLLEVRADNQPAIGLYGSVGFEVVTTRRSHYADGGDALVMQREINRGR
jgi:[ribosomal protein S18]-alanine N-acetyltransferase